MKAFVHYYYSTRHPRKPIRIDVVVMDGDEIAYTLDVHGRFATQYEASMVGRSIAHRYEEHEEDYGRITVEDMPPTITTVD